jgi:phosphorylcholine metabolism protein LicD
MDWQKEVRDKNLPMNKEQMWENLLDVKEAFDGAGILFTLEMGTLLGAYRDNDFISWDDDSDFLAFQKDKEKINGLKEGLRAKGFLIPEDVPASDVVFVRGGEKLDFWLFKRNSDTGKYQYDPERCPKWPEYDGEYLNFLSPIMFKGKEFLAPMNTLKFIELHYGKNWNIPTKERGWVFPQ